MRLIFIHGFGETASVFDEIVTQLPGEHVFIDLWTALGNDKRPELDMIDFSRELVESYDIKPDNIIIGHSLGGKIAHHIKHVNGNRIIQIASWTDQSKVLLPIKNKRVLLWLARCGYMFSKLNKSFMMKLYKREETKSIYEEAFDRLIHAHHNCSINQLRLIVEPISKAVEVRPDLRIHARRDNIIRYPDESFQEVPGDHFCLQTHSKEVSDAIKTIL